MVQVSWCNTCSPQRNHSLKNRRLKANVFPDGFQSISGPTSGPHVVCRSSPSLQGALLADELRQLAAFQGRNLPFLCSPRTRSGTVNGGASYGSGRGAGRCRLNTNGCEQETQNPATQVEPRPINDHHRVRDPMWHHLAPHPVLSAYLVLV